MEFIGYDKPNQKQFKQFDETHPSKLHTKDEVISLIHHFRFCGEGDIDKWIEENL